MQMAQIWVNLPRAHKMDPPGYQAITADQIGVATLPDGAGTVRVIAGEHLGVRGPAKTFTPVDDAGHPARRGRPRGVPRSGPPQRGAARDEGGDCGQRRRRVGERARRIRRTPASTSPSRRNPTKDAQLLLLAGEPIDEPVVSYGPFVMNTEGEIRQAMVDFQDGKFGRLDD